MIYKILRLIVTKLFVLIMSLTIAFIIIPLGVIVFTPIFLFRFVISKSAWFLRPDLGDILSPRSTIMSFDKFHEPNPKNIISFFIIFEGTISLEKVRQVFQNRVLPYKLPNDGLRFPELKQYQTDWMGFRFWKQDENFNLRNHIKNYKKSKDIFTTKDLKNLEKEALQNPLERNQSPWEILVINNYLPEDFQSEPQTILLLRLHHSICGGYSLMKFIVEGIFGKKVQIKNTAKIENVKRSMWINLLAPITSIFAFSDTMSLIAQGSVLDVPESRRTNRTVAVTEKIHLDSLKLLKNSLNVSLSSVILSACSSGVRSMMIRKNIQVPEEMLCLFSFQLPVQPDRLGNYFTHDLIKLPLVSLDGSAKNRITILSELYKELTTSTSIMFNSVLLDVTGGLFLPLAETLSSGFCPPIMVSNFSANFFNMKFEGHKGVDTYGFCGGSNVPVISFYAISFDGWMRISVVAEIDLLSQEETEQLAIDVEKELNYALIDLSKTKFKEV